MPARYKPGSEYKKRFRWHESVKSASFSPSREQRAPKAGLGSGEIAYVRSDIREPALQRRRRPSAEDQPSSLDAQNDRQTLAPGRTYKVPQHKAADKSSNKPRPTTSILTGYNRKSSDLTAQERAPPRPLMGETRVVSTTTAAPPLVKKDRHDSGGRSSDPNKNNNKTSRKVKTTPPKMSDARNGSSGDKVKSNIALQYQAGINLNRPKGAKYLSEYQRAFEWKKPLTRESPLMAAEQMVYNSNTNIAPCVPDKIPRHSEYQKQFKAWQPLQPPAQDQLMENAKRDIKAKYMVKTKSKKSKKGSLTPDRMRAAGVPSTLSPEQVKNLKNSQNPQQPFFPHSTTRKWKTEYKSNYKSPERFPYEDGVWKGAGPPHIQPKDDLYSDNDRKQRPGAPLRRTKSQHDLPNWFSEVMELRQKAQQYQHRARGTHFSREHVAQLIAKQAPMWDASSCTTTASTSSLSAPSVDVDRQEGPRTSHPLAAAGLTSRPGGGGQGNNNNISPVRRKLGWTEEDNNKDSSVGSIPTPEGFTGSVSASSDDFEMIESNGRPPTPKLNEAGFEQRHHLDRTTPAVGGAILTSPKPVRKNPSSSHQTPPGRTYVARSAPARTQVVDSRGILPGGTERGFDWPTSDDEDDDDTLRLNTPPPPLVQHTTARVTKTQGSPVPAGKPTKDPHQLNNQLRSPIAFQRHSRNFFETGPAMPVMPRGIDPHPAHTWAAGGAPREDHNGVGGGDEMSDSFTDDDDDDVVLPTRRRKEIGKGGQMRTMPVMRGEEEERRDEPARPRPATMHGERQGPLARPSSGSLHGRPMTAYPQTRQAAGDNITQSSSGNPGVGNPPPMTARLQNGQSRQQAWDVPRETNLHNGDDAMSTPRGSDRLSMSGISTVSSSSLASEVLERARKRRDDFWGVP